MGAPVKFTCPDINSIMNHIGDVISDLCYVTEDETPAGLQVKIDNAIKELERYITSNAFTNPLEHLRNSNSELRDWGEKQEDLRSGDQLEISRMDAEIDILTEENREHLSRIAQLEEQLAEADKLNNELQKENLELFRGTGF